MLETENVIDFQMAKAKRISDSNPLDSAIGKLRLCIQNNPLLNRFIDHGIPLKPVASNQNKPRPTNLHHTPTGHVYVDGNLYTMPLEALGFVFTRQALYLAYFAQSPEDFVAPGTRGTIDKVNYFQASFTVKEVEALWKKMVNRTISYLKDE